MKIGLQEIWNFMELMGDEALKWNFSLKLGNYEVSDISGSTIVAIQQDDNYDTETLPSLFTFREILWQPDLFVEAPKSLSPIRILKAYCQETMSMYDEKDELQHLYKKLMKGIFDCCENAEKDIEEEKKNLTSVLSCFRKCAFPIIKFFIYHPKNRKDYFIDAQKRLNYAVKIMLTQFYGQYSELSDPVWLVSKNSKITKSNKSDSK